MAYLATPPPVPSSDAVILAPVVVNGDSKIVLPVINKEDVAK